MIQTSSAHTGYVVTDNGERVAHPPCSACLKSTTPISTRTRARTRSLLKSQRVGGKRPTATTSMYTDADVCYSVRGPLRLRGWYHRAQLLRPRCIANQLVAAPGVRPRRRGRSEAPRGAQGRRRRPVRAVLWRRAARAAPWAQHAYQPRGASCRYVLWPDRRVCRPPQDHLQPLQRVRSKLASRH